MQIESETSNTNFRQFYPENKFVYWINPLGESDEQHKDIRINWK